MAAQLYSDFQARVQRGFRPRTSRAYRGKFRLYLALLVHLNQFPIDSPSAVALFIEYLAQQGLRAQSLTNYLSVLKHYFALYNLNTAATEHRSIKLAVRAVAYNAPLSFHIKGTLTINNLNKLVKEARKLQDASMIKALILLGFFGFYRLSTLVPPSVQSFSASRFPTHGDVVWGPPGAHIITKCSKSMQVSGQVHVVQLPALSDKSICPVSALRQVVSSNPHHVDLPIFTATNPRGSSIMTASRFRSAFRSIIKAVGLPPSEYGFHSLRRSGACWAFDHNMDLDHIKVHGGWRSDAIWRYLVKTPAVASSVAKTFQNCLN